MLFHRVKGLCSLVAHAHNETLAPQWTATQPPQEDDHKEDWFEVPISKHAQVPELGPELQWLITLPARS